MIAPPAGPPARIAPPSAQRWAWPGALLVVEFLALSVLIELPSGPLAARLASVARMLIPVVMGAGAAGILIARDGRLGAAVPAWPPEHRPWPALAAQLASFGVTAVLGWRLMGPRAPPVDASAFAAWLACVATTFALAAALVAPPLALLRHLVRHLGTPLLAFAIGLLSWRAVAAAEALWAPLRAATILGTAGVLRAFGQDVVSLPAESVIGAGGFEVEIAPACSGVEGLGMQLVFQAVWLSLARSRVRFGRAVLLLVPAGAVAALCANVLRIAVLVQLGAMGHPDLALGAFHSKLGWLLFIGVALATLAAAEHLPWLRRESDPADGGGLPPEASAHVAPLVAALVAALVTGLWAQQGLDAWYGARVVAGAGALWLVRRSLPAPSFSLAWPPLALAALVCAVWIPLGGTEGSTLGEAVARLAPGERAAWIAVRLIGACAVIPVVEELAFRGFLLPWLASAGADGAPRRGWTWPAVVLSSLAFGALHEQWLLGAAAGAAFAAARAWRGRLGDAILAHAACNAGIAAAVLLGGRWDLWG